MTFLELLQLLEKLKVVQVGDYETVEHFMRAMGADPETHIPLNREAADPSYLKGYEPES